MGELNQHWNGERRSMPNGAVADSARLTRWAEALLSRFSVIWPKAWADLTALTPHDLLVAEWTRGLEGLVAPLFRGLDPGDPQARLASTQQAGALIIQGLDHCRAQLSWPPSIAEFMAACRQGANAEQRAFAEHDRRLAKERQAEKERLALRNGTWGDVADNVREHVRKVREQLVNHPARTLANIQSGLWTREKEDKFRHHAQPLMGANPSLASFLKPCDWPDGEIA